MTWTLCTSSAIKRKAGAKAFISDALIADAQDEAEGEIVLQTRRDWVTDYDNVDAKIKPALASACSALAAMKVIEYDMSGFTSRLETQTMLDLLFDNYNKNLAAVKEADGNTIRSVD